MSREQSLDLGSQLDQQKVRLSFILVFSAVLAAFVFIGAPTFLYTSNQIINRGYEDSMTFGGQLLYTDWDFKGCSFQTSDEGIYTILSFQKDGQERELHWRNQDLMLEDVLLRHVEIYHTDGYLACKLHYSSRLPSLFSYLAHNYAFLFPQEN